MAFLDLAKDEPDPEKAKQAMRDMMGPQVVDNGIRQAITMCWMMLPDDRKNVAEVEAEIRRLVDRALQNLKDDASSFGIK
jgi:hypothetical protein